MSYRVAPQPNELINRNRPITFTYADRQYTAFEGDTIASALAANGVRVVAKSFKYHRPRGLFGYGHATDSMVQIDNRVSESMWLTPVVDGMVVEPAQTVPMHESPPLTIVQEMDQTLSIGHRYKEFIHPRSEWDAREQLMREGAGLGKLDIEARYEVGFDKQHLHTDVVVVGAGPAGLSAAMAASACGAKVILLDENPFLGGHLGMSRSNTGALDALTNVINSDASITVMTSTLVSGWFEDHWLFAVRGKRMYKIRAKATVIATGAEDQPQLFDNNDLPGVIMASAAQRLLNCYGATVGQDVLVVSANADGWALALEMQQAGVNVVGVVDHRANGGEISEKAIAAGITGHWEHTVVAANGENGVEQATVASIHDLSRRATVACDTIALSTAWAPRYDLAYLTGCKFAYDETVGEFRPKSTPAGIFLAGRITGTHQLDAQMQEGVNTGRAAAASVGLDAAPLPTPSFQEPNRTSTFFRVVGDPKAKRFIDRDKDVTDKDVAYSVAEAFDSIELVKRYTKISTGPSQGKWSSVNTIHLLAELNGTTVAKTGKTTSRAPARPIKLGNLAGQMMEPVRVTPIHHWHKANGAKMMTAGLWIRPEHYGDINAEVRAVRERVGLIDVSTLGKIKLTGPGVGLLLDKLYINKFSKLRVGRVRYGIMCTAEGVIMDDGVTARISKNEWYMTTTSGGAGAVYEWIQWWVQSGWGDGVHLTSVSDGTAAFNLAGPRSRETLQKLTDVDISNKALPYMRWKDVDIAGATCRLLRIGFTGEQSFEIQVSAGQALGLWEALMAAGSEFDIMTFGVEAQRVLRLEKAHFIVGQDTDALADPLSSAQGWAVKLDKSDFLGKRAISRIGERGIKQKLVGFKVADTSIVPEEGLQIVREVEKCAKHPIGLEILGYITSCKYSPTLNEVIGLCWLPTKMAEQAGTPFNIRRNSEFVEGTVFHGAFYDPEGKKLKS